MMHRDWKTNREDHSEVLDPNPIELAMNGEQSTSIKDEIMEQLKAMLQLQKEELLETVEEFWDLDIEDDVDPISSKYEVEDMIPEYIDDQQEEEQGRQPERLEGASSAGPEESEPERETPPPPESGQ